MMMKTPIAAAAAAASACRVWVRPSSPCVFGTSVYESLRAKDTSSSTPLSPSFSYHCDRVLVDLEEREDGSVVLAPSAKGVERLTTTNGTRLHRGIPLGRARDCPTLSPRAMEDTRLDRRRRRPFVNLAVVGMVMAGENHDDDSVDRGSSHREDKEGNSWSNDSDAFPSLLVTRRPSYMRSFPGAFVFPGGNVDESDASLEHALSREIFEETGLRVPEDAWTLECLWESVYPTELPAPAPHDEESDPDGAIKAHHLVCYFSGEPETKSPPKQERNYKPSLELCQEEVDGAVWMSPSNMRNVLKATEELSGKAKDNSNRSASSERLLEAVNNQTVTLHATGSIGTSEDNPIPLSDLAGIYPRLENTDGRFCGIAQGSLFALEEFVRNKSKN